MKFSITLAPYLAVVGGSLTQLDENEQGADDFAGTALSYLSEAGVAIEEGGELPPIPELLARGTTEKLSKGARLTLQIVAPLLTLAQFQFKDAKLRKVFKYASQVLTQLLAGKPVTIVPISL